MIFLLCEETLLYILSKKETAVKVKERNVSSEKRGIENSLQIDTGFERIFVKNLIANEAHLWHNKWHEIE